MELKQTFVLIKLGPENEALEGVEIRPGEFLTTKIPGHPGRELTVQRISAQAGGDTAKNLGMAAWESAISQAAGLNTQFVFQTEKARAEMMRERERAARKAYLGRRGPRRGR